MKEDTVVIMNERHNFLDYTFFICFNGSEIVFIFCFLSGLYFFRCATTLLCTVGLGKFNIRFYLILFIKSELQLRRKNANI